ncbi:hypothetical protein fugu_017269 [Takifugu bimaculatus]|uniref:Uncharacterized protein n=1 Tax=Takifugu bimaculatus TaxID=433685 RepID=A0A4Z2BT54_9TELE|nr:hypothetical protein fugu_017269 [Takifugu bimaculatus]
MRRPERCSKTTSKRTCFGKLISVVKASHLEWMCQGWWQESLLSLCVPLLQAVLGIYFCKGRFKTGRQSSQTPVRMTADGHPVPESVPLGRIPAPGLPSYNEALTSSGQHDAPPPPYSGGVPSVNDDPQDIE